MKITAYTTKSCFYCEQLKKLFIKAELEVEYIDVTEREERLEFQSQYPKVRAFPHVIIDGVEHGGLVNVAKYLVKNGYVSTKKG
jgi:glutaredoxin